MDHGSAVAAGDPCEAAVSRLETTLRAAVHEVHVDVAAFKQRTERRVEEACHACTEPLSRALAALRQENRLLSRRMDALAALVDGLVTAANNNHTATGANTW